MKANDMADSQRLFFYFFFVISYYLAQKKQQKNPEKQRFRLFLDEIEVFRGAQEATKK